MSQQRRGQKSLNDPAALVMAQGKGDGQGYNDDYNDEPKQRDHALYAPEKLPGRLAVQRVVEAGDHPAHPFDRMADPLKEIARIAGEPLEEER